ncbi:MAG: tetratricopeptide repeat protein [Planctomycetes bacterium]|nr:tetratricopeptide repeat protein [Planctomycetota bacterium]
MSVALDTADIAEILAAEELSSETIVELRRSVHCSIEKRARLEQIAADFGPVAGKFSSENKAQVRRGVALWILGRVEEAAKALEPARSSRERALALGLSYLELDHAATALPLLKEALESDAEDGHVKLALLEARIKSGAVEEAAKMVSQLAKKFDGSADYHYLRGLLSDVQGFRAEALEGYEKALEVEPGYAKALFRMAHTMDLRGDDARALELYEQLRKLRPCHLHAMINLGTIYEDRGDYDRAADCYRAVLEYYPNHARARLYLKDAVASQSMFYDEDAIRREQKLMQVLGQPVAEISCSPRVRAALQRLNVTTLGDLAQKSEEEMLTLPNFGRTSLREVKEILAARGLNMVTAEGGAPAPEASMETAAAPAGSPSDDAVRRNLSDFEWSGRIKKLFEKLGVVTIGDLLKVSETDLLKNKNLGMTSIREIRKKLGQLGVAMREE